MKRRQLLFTILKSIAVAIVAGRSAPAQEDLDPVKMMPDTHKVLFENKLVRVIEGRVPAAGYEPKHRHPHCVLVSLGDFDAEIKTFPDGEWKRVHRAFGTKPKCADRACMYSRQLFHNRDWGRVARHPRTMRCVQRALRHQAMSAFRR